MISSWDDNTFSLFSGPMGDDDAVVGALLGAAAGEADGDGHAVAVPFVRIGSLVYGDQRGISSGGSWPPGGMPRLPIFFMRFIIVCMS